MVLIGSALIFGVVIWSSYRSEHFIAGVALALAAIALWWTVVLAAKLENIVGRVGRDVRRIADAIAPETGPGVDSPAIPERLDRVAESASDTRTVMLGLRAGITPFV